MTHEDDRERRRREARQRRYALRAGLWQLSSLSSVKGCARNVLRDAGHASLVLQDGKAGFEGLQLCSSIWACPCCSARIRQGRAVEVETAGVRHLNDGGALLFVTLTLPHDVQDPLARSLDAVLNGWREVQQRKGWKQLTARLGLVGFIRATEVTYTPADEGGSGWHPHLHLLLFLEREVGLDSLEDLYGKLHDYWAHAITRRGFRAPGGGGVGVNVRVVEGRTGNSAAGQLAAYLTKVQDAYGESWNVGSEMLRGDLKNGRRSASLTPFDLAAQALGLAVDAHGERVPARPDRAQLWHEFERASKGRRAIYWSKGLRARYATPEVPDEQLPEVVTDPASVVVVATFTAQQWRQLIRRRHLLTLLLDLAEHDRLSQLHLELRQALAPPGLP
jgi:hypothetical protein